MESNKEERLLMIYDLIAKYSEDPDAVAIAERKIAALKRNGVEGASGEQISRDSTSAKFDGAETEARLSAIRQALNNSNARVDVLRGADISGRIGELPESGEKYYLHAVVGLRIDSTRKGLKIAAGHLRKALAFDPQNGAYQLLLDAIGG